MAIVGLGTDLVDIGRIKGLIERHGQAIAERILTQNELTDWLNTKHQDVFLAKRFAAKEAAVKALGTGIAQGIGFQQLAVGHDALGKPLLVLTGAAALRAQALGASQWHLSISDERTHAMATVILES